MASKAAGTPIRIEPLAGGGALQLESTDVRGVKIVRFPLMREARGALTVGEFRHESFPFRPQRHFVVFSVPSNVSRGEHGHKQCQQLLICVHGHCVAMVDDGVTRREFILDNPAVGLHIPPMIWGTQHSYSEGAALLVLASEAYDPDDYIRDYAAFQSAVRTGTR